MKGGNPALFGVPSSVNRGLRAVGNGERYLCLERDVHRDLREQIEYLQCKTQAVIECDTLILCRGTDSDPYLVSHVV